MILIDSYGWIEYFGDGPLSEKYAAIIEKAKKEEIVTPTVIIYEVYKRLKCIKGEEVAVEAFAQLSLTRVVELTSALCMKAADISIDFEIGMADAIVVATANECGAQIVTSDQHFKKIKGVKFISNQ